MIFGEYYLPKNLMWGQSTAYSFGWGRYVTLSFWDRVNVVVKARLRLFLYAVGFKLAVVTHFLVASSFICTLCFYSTWVKRAC